MIPLTSAPPTSATKEAAATTVANDRSDPTWRSGVVVLDERTTDIASTGLGGPTTRRETSAICRSSASISSIAEFLSEAPEYAREAGSRPRRAKTKRRGELRGVEPDDVAHGDEGSVLGVEAIPRREQIERVDSGRWIDASDHEAGVGEELRLGAPPAFPQEVLGLVHGDRDESRTEPLGLAYRTEFPPHGRPGRLHGPLGKGLVAGHEGADPPHVLVIGRHDPCERVVVAGSREGDDPSEIGRSLPGHDLHTR